MTLPRPPSGVELPSAWSFGERHVDPAHSPRIWRGPSVPLQRLRVACVPRVRLRRPGNRTTRNSWQNGRPTSKSGWANRSSSSKPGALRCTANRAPPPFTSTSKMWMGLTRALSMPARSPSNRLRTSRMASAVAASGTRRAIPGGCREYSGRRPRVHEKAPRWSAVPVSERLSTGAEVARQDRRETSPPSGWRAGSRGTSSATR